MESQHSPHNDKCPINDPETQMHPATRGLPCTCERDGFRNENEVGNLSGQELLDALTEAWKNKHYKGWTFQDMVHGPSVLPVTVYDSDNRISKHEAIISMGFSKGSVTEMTLMVTTPAGTTYQDFVPKGPATSTP